MNKFKKPPELTIKEKEKRAEDFVSFSSTATPKQLLEKTIEKGKKEPTKTIYLRAPQSYFNDIQEIVSLTGLSINAVCLELLRPAIKNKLRELRDI